MFNLRRYFLRDSKQLWIKCTASADLFISSSSRSTGCCDQMRVCYLSTKTSDRRMKNNNKGYNNRNKALPVADQNDLPLFSALLRKFYRQTHPDLLRASHPRCAEINDKSWQVLNGILSTLKERNSYPPRMIQSIPFYMRVIETEHADSHIHNDMSCLELNIVTGGGDCKKQLTKTMQQFFLTSKISLDGKFEWDRAYFPLEKE